MNFSQFSKNKLNKEQMMAVKGGKEQCWQTGVSDAGNPIKTCLDGCTIKRGESIHTSDDTWGWKQEFSVNWCSALFV